MPMERATTRTVGNPVFLSSRAKTKGRRMQGILNSRAKTKGRRMQGMAVSTLFPQDLSALGVKVSVT